MRTGHASVYPKFNQTHSSSGVGKVDPQEIHSLDDGGQRLDGVAVHHGFVLLALISAEPILVNNPVGCV